MRIRSFTCFYNPGSTNAQLKLERLTNLRQEAIQRIGNSGYEIQTTRLVTTPFPYWLKALSADKSIPVIQQLENEALEIGYDYLSLGPAVDNYPESFGVIPYLMENTRNTFFGGMMASLGKGVNLTSVRACAKIIKKLAVLSADGFTNTRFAALANVDPHTPFFPAAYHEGDGPVFALAIECADLAISAFSGVQNLGEGRANLIKEIEFHADKLDDLCSSLSIEHKVDFMGMDFSLAPFPEEWCSLGAAIEKLGPNRIGLAGTLASAAFLADTLDLGNWRRVGFNGLMLPVLEDSRLAIRSSDGSLTLKDLLLCSAVCGCGLDTVPLPGDITIDQIEGILLDVAALAVRLNKPLTARLMPIPGKSAGEKTGFDFGYFANTCVMDPIAEPLHGPLEGDETIIIRPRRL
jgi:uncharacterized protein (UPF0210 family)